MLLWSICLVELWWALHVCGNRMQDGQCSSGWPMAFRLHYQHPDGTSQAETGCCTVWVFAWFLQANVYTCWWRRNRKWCLWLPEAVCLFVGMFTVKDKWHNILCMALSPHYSFPHSSFVLFFVAALISPSCFIGRVSSPSTPFLSLSSNVIPGISHMVSLHMMDPPVLQNESLKWNEELERY